MKISRRLCLQGIFLLLLSLVAVTMSAAKDSPKDKYLLFVGTYTQKESKGIYAYRFDAASSELTALGESAAVLPDTGALGPVKERQDAPHSHWIEASAHNRFVYVSDLGLDRVLIYRFDATNGTLTKGEAAATKSGSGSPNASDFFSATLAPGTGPRHVAFSGNGNFMYVLGELDSTVTVFANDARETFRSVQRISALPT